MVTGEGDGVAVWQLVLFSSSPPGQSVVPSHSLVVVTHVPSLQANWSGAQVTANHRKDEVWSLMRDGYGQMCIKLKAQSMKCCVVISTFTWTDSFVGSRGAVCVSVTHSVCRDTLVPRALKLPRCTHTPIVSKNK